MRVCGGANYKLFYTRMYTYATLLFIHLLLNFLLLTIVFHDFFRTLGACIDVVLAAVWPTVNTQLAPVRTLYTPTSVEIGRECQSGWWFSQKQSKWYWGDGFHLLYSSMSAETVVTTQMLGAYLAVGSHMGSLALVYLLGNECSPASQPLHNRSTYHMDADIAVTEITFSLVTYTQTWLRRNTNTK